MERVTSSPVVAVVTVHRRTAVQRTDQDVLGTVRPIVEDDRAAVRRDDCRLETRLQRAVRRVLEKIVGECARIQAQDQRSPSQNALEAASMPAKLSDCQPGNDDIAELFIVEGDSALGTAKAARNSSFQALLPIRGKILNVQKASLSQMLSNKECASIIQVVGAGSGASFDLSQARYNKIIMMTDADVDGAHIVSCCSPCSTGICGHWSKPDTCMRPSRRCIVSRLLAKHKANTSHVFG